MKVLLDTLLLMQLKTNFKKTDSDVLSRFGFSIQSLVIPAIGVPRL
jgi:hypothetical protein